MELLDKINQWHLLFIFAVIFIILFRDSIRRLIDRTEKIDKSGLSAAAPEAQNEGNSNTEKSVDELLNVVGDSLVINDQEARIIADLESRGLDTSGDTVKVLVKHLAGAQLLAAFERIYSIIFGSQIELLKRLNELAGQGRSRQYVEQFFKETKTSAKNTAIAHWKLNQYLEFLFSNALIVQNNDQYHITNLGGEFLAWLVKANKSEQRVL
ncbi:winged helix-turn-helix domain-containing protein [Alkalimarinus coralli]|uniref:winged helix-turn-helix domain-containing protein n=1 Tax=Alkalimarinus coralli TaxID=2935863 RepID=UPI00202AEAF9|nr:winged helix-turn-helix domain-containing protein [Alkalimarinus coralli]